MTTYGSWRRKPSADFVRLLIQVHGFSKPSGGEDAHCLLLKAVHCFHHAGRIYLSFNLIQIMQQCAAVAQSTAFKGRVQGEARGLIGAQSFELVLHAGLQLALKHL